MESQHAGTLLESSGAIRLVTVHLSGETDKNWLGVRGVTYISNGHRGQAGLSLKRNCTLVSMCMWTHVRAAGASTPFDMCSRTPGIQLLARRLGDRRDGNAFCGREGHQSYNWNKTIPVMRDKDFLKTLCEREEEESEGW